MSSRARKAQKLTKRDSSGSNHSTGSAKHARTSDDNHDYSSQRRSGDGSGESDRGAKADLDHEFLSIGIKDFLDFDPRPSFVVTPDIDVGDAFKPIYTNDALRQNYQVVRSVFQHLSPNSPPSSPKVSSAEFRFWVKDSAQNVTPDASNPQSFSFCGMLWTTFTIRNRWTVISGSSSHAEARSISGSLSLRSESPGNAQFRPQTDHMKDRQLAQSRSEQNLKARRDSPSPAFDTPGTPDWTLAQPTGVLSPHVIFARSIDWASTPLGDMASWSTEFRQITNLLFANPHPCALFWGKELTVLYNKAYADGVAGHKHPGLMGTGFWGPFAELWETVGPTFDECVRTGKSVAMKDQMLPIERHGFLEETFFTWSLTPLYGGTDKILGLYNAPFETTRQTINDRRTRTLLKLGEEVSTAKSVATFWPLVLNALKDNEFDFPFALLYSIIDEVDIDDGSSTSSESSHAMKSCILEGSLGVPQGHPAAPTRLDLKRSRGGFIPAFRDAMHTREPKILNIMDGTLSESLIEGLEWRGFGDPCKLAIVSPIRPTTGENVLGFLVIGVNPRRPYDSDYEDFTKLLNTQLAASLASVTLFEEEIRRGNNAAEAAALERSRLSEELAVQRGRLQRIAEVSPVGMFSIDPEGLLLEANDRWFEMTGHARDGAYDMSWMDTILESSRPIMEKGWERLTVDRLPWSAELQMRKPWIDPSTGEEVDHWILAASQPEFGSDGSIKTIMGSITDITLQKRSAKDAETRAHLSEQLLLRTQEAEALQKQRLIEAEETRRQQNNFIDITSHEMRNPLSAIVQCADTISTSMDDILKSVPSTSLSTELSSIIQTSIDAAETIQLCAQHQKGIVDDILTISKLDSNLLLITPVPVQPVKVVQQALRMFTAECLALSIHIECHIESSIQEMKVDWVMLDPSRVLQVLINLLTNAIKFTKTKEKRIIDVSLGSTKEPPANSPTKFRYFPTNKARSDVTAEKDWGLGEILYLRFEVRDTGCGLSEGEMKNLFNRFSQASPRTHVQYGGSGLGLFISRQLTELQGGEIGVVSEAGIGSTFAFYIKVRRSEREDTGIAESRLASEVESNARIAINISKTVKEHDNSVSKLLQHAHSTGESSRTSILPEANLIDWHVLIVEDNLVNQRLLAAQIKRLGCTTHVANHGGEALDLLRQTKHFQGREDDGIDLSIILMDLEMPVMDGLTCVRKIREMEDEGLIQGRIPIIAVTANARGEQIVAAKDSGMDDVMPKPFRIKQLVPKIEALLHKTARGQRYDHEPGRIGRSGTW